MSKLKLVYAPNDIFRQKAAAVSVVDDHIRSLIDDMFAVMQAEQGVGLGANMVGI